MKVRIVAAGMFFGLTLFWTGGGAAQPDPSGIQQYKLQPGSDFETGCFGPCLCPDLLSQLQGTFSLQRVGFDPLFTYYRVSGVRWTVARATSNLTILGSGTYKVGGEFAVQHQMSLDLSVDGNAPQHFDSGLVLGGGEFPQILIKVSLHQNLACIDTVMHVDAVDPVVTSVDAGSDPSKVFWAMVAPNPFQRETEFRLVLPHSGDLDLTIYDVRGHVVRHLVKAAWVSAGPHSISWDGRRDQGSACAAGVYFLASQVGTERTTMRIVKLK